jgi:hypothetical protein
MISILPLNAVDNGFESRSGQTKDYEIGIVASPLSTQHQGVRLEQRLVGSESG